MMFSHFPLLTLTIARRAEAAHIAFWTHKAEVLRSLAGNPYDVQIRRFGGAVALLACGASQNDFFNRIGNMSGDDLPYLDAIIEWYRPFNVEQRFDIIPSNAHPDLLQGLARHGYYQASFYIVLYGLPQTVLPEYRAVNIREATIEDRDMLADLYFAGFGIPKIAELGFLRESVRLLVGIPGIHCLIAEIGTMPVAMAILSLREGIGYMATATTLPAFRGNGCQKALLRRRIELAAQAGCEFIVGSTTNLTSQHNMEHAGMRVAYTKAIWKKLR